MTATPNVLRLFGASGRRAERNAIDYVHLTAPQDEYTRFDCPEAAWFDGNALGKSFAGAWDIIQFLRGKHPHKRKKGGGPAVGLIVGYSYEQMLPMMEKLWFLVPKDEVAASVGFTDGRGFTGKPPRLVLTNGARLVFATYKSGSKRIAGGQYDFVVCDEPPDPRVLGEIRPRLFRRRGWLRVLMTPVPDMPDISDLRERIETKRIPSLNVHLTEASCWPAGYPAPWHWQSEIDTYAETLLGPERGMRIRGDLRPIAADRWIHAYDPDRHLRKVDLRQLLGWHLSVGVDHGTTGRKQTAVLAACRRGIRENGQPHAQVRFLACATGKGFTSPAQDARMIRRMLESVGVPYDAVDYWTGDVPVYSQKEDTRKSNASLRAALAAEYSRGVKTIKPIDTPSKGHGSLLDGARTLNTMFALGDAYIDPRAAELGEAFLSFDGDKDHPAKDLFDAGRYAAIRGIGGPVGRALVAHY